MADGPWRRHLPTWLKHVATDDLGPRTAARGRYVSERIRIRVLLEPATICGERDRGLAECHRPLDAASDCECDSEDQAWPEG